MSGLESFPTKILLAFLISPMLEEVAAHFILLHLLFGEEKPVIFSSLQSRPLSYSPQHPALKGP
jgi:hypothetical protein